ncbi:glycosyltransferase family protein [Rehaibacterium terrae]|uniref:Glycosyltransferase involved in cell wall biosynthesis n=1 Tax=Rehaibacterium terrae TaxID=1341696 RepID=A0A7W7V758_9GAMM|nr:glycosyltransferase [Rehaibacterium terrae]MBB5014456.1 glycosyltransferase involved in cell wall biosynthesis [Rehaibacterium terrae]
MSAGDQAGDRDGFWLRQRVLRAELSLIQALSQATSEENRENSFIGRLRKEDAGLQATVCRLREQNQALQQRLHVLEDELQRVLMSRCHALATMLSEARSLGGLLRLPIRLLRLLRKRSTVDIATATGRPEPSQALPIATGKDSAPALYFAPLPAFTPAEADPLPVEVRPLLPAEEPPETIAELRLAVILDQFSLDGVSPECRVEMLLPDRWEQQMRQFRPHVLFVESAWRGRQGEWQGMVERASEVLRSVVMSCRHAGIPTVFWNKEDPLHFEAFIETARLFDIVMTTDSASIPRYKRELGHDRVFLLPFAVQPRLHHPVRNHAPKNRFLFAGAWYGRAATRQLDFERMAHALSLVAPLDIYDRNYGTGDPALRFPARYAGMVRPAVPYQDTPALYRRYRFGINLNTIKHSPTMFARRALELAACNVSVYSNHARGLRTLLGELVIATDDPEQLLAQAYDEAASPDAPRHRLRRAMALRRVLSQHTWSRRLQYLTRQALGTAVPRSQAPVVMFGHVRCANDWLRLLASFERQREVDAGLVVFCTAPPETELPPGVRLLDPALLNQPVADVFGDAWLAPVHADDYHGPHYLCDLALAREYAAGRPIGKAAYYRLQGGALVLEQPEQEYRAVRSLAWRRALFPAADCRLTLAELIEDLDGGSLEAPVMISIDSFSYLEGGAARGLPEFEVHGFDPGIDLQQLLDYCEQLPAAASAGWDGLPGLRGDLLAHLFNCGVVPPGVSACARRHRLEICSTLPAGREDALFSMSLAREVFERNGTAVVCLDARPDNVFDFYLDALDVHGVMLARERLPPEVTVRLDPPAGTAGYRLAVRLRGSFVRQIDGLWLAGRPASPLTLPGRGRLLLVSNGYPEVDRPYQNAFVHRRVLGYLRRGLAVDVLGVRPMQQVRSYEYEGVPVIQCDPDTLRATVARSGHPVVAAHFLDEAVWAALAEVARHTRVVVWLHGAEIQPWTRRAFNYTSDEEQAEAIAQSERRMAFWRRLLSAPPDGLHLVFVSRAFAEQVWQDLGLRLPEERWSVIPNPIDTALFQYIPKPPEQRLRILSVRPHASRIYANDLVAATIHELSSHPLFLQMEFHLIGDGPLFDDNFAGLERYPNVQIERRFMRQGELARLYRDYGIFLVPTRGDTQGVSRDEAMACGMVPVTNPVGAVPEFVDGDCGMLCEPESPRALAEALLALVESPERFLSMSRAAAMQIRRSRSSDLVLARETDLLLPWLQGEPITSMDSSR